MGNFTQIVTKLNDMIPRGRLYFVVDTLEYLARKAGAERVMLGSDMPFPIGDPAPTRVLEGAYFNEAQKKGILGETAQGVFRVRPDCWCPR